MFDLAAGTGSAIFNCSRVEALSTKFTASQLPIHDKVKLAALVTYHGGEYSRALVLVVHI